MQRDVSYSVLEPVVVVPIKCRVLLSEDYLLTYLSEDSRCNCVGWLVFSARAVLDGKFHTNNGSPLKVARPALSAALAAEHSAALRLSFRAECALQLAFQVTRRGRRQAAACRCGSCRPHAAGAAASGLSGPAWRHAGRAEPHPPLQGARHLHRQLRPRLVRLLGLADRGRPAHRLPGRQRPRQEARAPALLRRRGALLPAGRRGGQPRPPRPLARRRRPRQADDDHLHRAGLPISPCISLYLPASSSRR